MISHLKKRVSTSKYSRIKFPKLFKFRNYCFLRRAPKSIELIIEQAENVENFKNLLKNISKRDIKKIQERTKWQATSEEWYKYRKCAITSTATKRLLSVAKRLENNNSFNKAISKYGNSYFRNEAMEWGVRCEKYAIEEVWKYFRAKHLEPQRRQVGLCMDKDIKFLCASPDNIFSCICCGNHNERYYYTIEAKCPFILRDEGIQASNKLPYLDDKGLLKSCHSYYHQICVACGVNDIKCALFIIWTPFGSKIQEIEFDSLLYEKIKSDAKYYYYNYYLKSQKIY